MYRSGLPSSLYCPDLSLRPAYGTLEALDSAHGACLIGARPKPVFLNHAFMVVICEGYKRAVSCDKDTLSYLDFHYDVPRPRTVDALCGRTYFVPGSTR